MKFLIRGGKKLLGGVVVPGAKNAATKMMVASLLTAEPVVLKNFPRIGDTEITQELCELLGAKVDFLEKNICQLQTLEIKNHQALTLSRKNRIPILALGPLLSRVGRAEVPALGGDKIGHRPVDLHVRALTLMGAEIEVTENSYRATAPNGLRGANIKLDFPSVGATENIILAAVLAKGTTVISNAAVEPEILDLIKLLQKMGAIIELGADRVITICGVLKLHGATHTILPDRNEVVSFACLAVATDGKIFVRGAKQDDLITFLNALRKVGGDYTVDDDGIWFFRAGELKATEIETDSHPGFMTDWQQPFMVLLTQANGVSFIHETIYEDRLGYTKDLNKMGAEITVFPKCLGELKCRFNGMGFNHSAVITGPTRLKGAELEVRDLRSGMVDIIAALVAPGESVISNIEEIERGYEDIEGKLRGLGAEIVRV